MLGRLGCIGDMKGVWHFFPEHVKSRWRVEEWRDDCSSPNNDNDKDDDDNGGGNGNDALSMDGRH